MLPQYKFSHLGEGVASTSVKGQIVNILGFTGYTSLYHFFFVLSFLCIYYPLKM